MLKIPEPSESVTKILETVLERKCALCYTRHLIKFQDENDNQKDEYDYDCWHINSAIKAKEYKCVINKQGLGFKNSEENLATAIITLCLKEKQGDCEFVRIPVNQPDTASKIPAVRGNDIAPEDEKTNTQLSMLLKRIEVGQNVLKNYNCQLCVLGKVENCNNDSFFTYPHMISGDVVTCNSRKNGTSTFRVLCHFSRVQKFLCQIFESKKYIFCNNFLTNHMKSLEKSKKFDEYRNFSDFLHDSSGKTVLKFKFNPFSPPQFF